MKAKSNPYSMTVGILIALIGVIIASGFFPIASPVATTSSSLNTTTTTTSQYTTATVPQISASSSTSQSSASSTITTIYSSSTNLASSTTTTQGQTTDQIQLIAQQCSQAIGGSCFRVGSVQFVIQKNGQTLYSCSSDANGYCQMNVPTGLGSVNVCFASGAVILACNNNVNLDTNPNQTITYYTSGFSVINLSVLGIPCASNSSCSGLASAINLILGFIILLIGIGVIAYGKIKK